MTSSWLMDEVLFYVWIAGVGYYIIRIIENYISGLVDKYISPLFKSPLELEIESLDNPEENDLQPNQPKIIQTINTKNEQCFKYFKQLYYNNLAFYNTIKTSAKVLTKLSNLVIRMFKR